MTDNTQINSLLTQIKQATNYQINKRILKEKVDTDLCVTHNGGLFKVDMGLITFLSIWDDDVLFITDTYDNPIKVDRLELLTLAKQQYQKVMNTWHIQHEELKRARKV